MFQIKNKPHLWLDAKIKDPDLNDQDMFPRRSALHNHTNGIKIWRPTGRELPVKKATISYAAGFNRNQVFKI